MKNLSLEEFVDKICEIFPVIMNSFIKQRLAFFIKGKITVAQFFILDYLYRYGETKMSDIANYVGVSTAALTGIIDRLARDKYVTRVYPERDRRIIKVRLLSKGKEIIEKINSQRKQTLKDIFAKLNQEDRNQYLRILLEIKKILTLNTEKKD
ncbi:MAG: MarR family transcriptional regulator [Candidatus Omnitrophica bacterium]|nr:MarR family transcriptional regulator [Candidatus Omnitrophota bacterium]